MLTRLRVRDLALVAAAEVNFGPGLNLLTGETGSGKSLIVDALALSLGGRATTDQVRHGASRALVESFFTGALGDAANLAEAAPDGGFSLSREVGGRGGARVCGRPATPGRLREIGRHLVGIHGQHEHQSLLDPDAQTGLLDSYAGLEEPRERMLRTHGAWAQAGRRLHDLERLRARGRSEQEYLRHQLNELDSARLRSGEDAELVAERSVARHSVRILQLAEEAMDALRAEEGVAAAAGRVRAAAELDPRLADLAGRLEALGEEIQDSTLELRRHTDGLDSDPGRLEEIEERLALLESIKRKYGGSIESALAEQERLSAQVLEVDDIDGAIAAAGQDLDRAAAEMADAAADLTRLRTAAAARLGGTVQGELAGLRLEGSRFEIALRPLAEIGPEGAEAAEMMFTANPGEPLSPLHRVASGGELSRVMLAIKTASAESDRLPTLIFDEVDAGIGGETAFQVGLRLRALGEDRQVLVVTHLPQIACFADHHLVVEKVGGGEGRSVVAVRELVTLEERAAELARMMSGRITDKALARAHELLEEAAR